MGTLQTAVTRALVNLRSENQYIHAFKDAQILGHANRIVYAIHQKLINTQSVMVVDTDDITLEDNTETYTPSFDWLSLCDEAIFIDDNTFPLRERSVLDRRFYDTDTVTAEPEAFYIDKDGDIGFLDIPNDAYTAHVFFFTKPTAMTAVATDTIPYAGIWDLVFQDMLELSLEKSQDRDVTITAIELSDHFNEAMAITRKRGLIHRRINSGFFDLEGT